MSASTIDLLWVVIIGTSTVVVLAVALIASLVISHRQRIAAQEEKMRALEESQALFRSLVENINDIYYISDARGKMVYASPNLFARTGYTEREIIGQSYARLLTREDRRRVVEHYLRCVNNGTRDTTYEFRARLKNGNAVWVEQATRIQRAKDGTVLEFRSVVRDVTERKRTEELQKNFTKRVIEAQESERKRIAFELHDSIGQMLSSVKFRLHDLLGKTSPPSGNYRVLSDVDGLLEKTLQEVRRVSQNLRPSVLDDLGLISAVRTICEEFELRTGIRINLDVPPTLQRFPSEIELALFRIIQETLNNVEKHSGATELAVRIELQHSKLQVTVEDNGKGFNPKLVHEKSDRTHGIGLESIQERAASIGATVHISSTIGSGSEITIRIPVPATNAEAPIAVAHHHRESVKL